VWLLVQDEGLPPVSYMTVAPKRNLHHAVDRNRAKRLMRDVCRHTDAALREQVAATGRSLLLGVIYADTTVCTHDRIEEAYDRAMRRLSEKFKEYGEQEPV